METKTDTELTSITTELRSKFGRVESRITDLHTSSDHRFTTQDRELGSLSEELVALTLRVMKFEDGLVEVQTTLATQAENITNFGRAQTSILTSLDVFATTQAQAADCLTGLKLCRLPPFSNPLRHFPLFLPLPLHFARLQSRPLVIPATTRWLLR